MLDPGRYGYLGNSVEDASPHKSWQLAANLTRHLNVTKLTQLHPV